MPTTWAGSQIAALVRSTEWREWYVRRNTTPPGAPNPSVPNVWYCGSTKWTAVTAWAATTAYNVGDLRRQLAAPAVGSERVFRCISAGTSGGSEPTWNLSQGSSTNDATVQWIEVTGQAAYNWTAPFARVQSAFAGGWMAPGDILYLSNNSAETQAVSMTLTAPGTAALPTQVICVNDAGNVPPQASDVTTGASVTTTGNSPLTFSSGQYCYWNGVTFNCATGNNTANIGFSAGPQWQRLENCALKLLTATQGSTINIGTNGSASQASVELINTTVQFGAVLGQIKVYGRLTWSNTAAAITGSTFPTTLLGGGPGSAVIVGVDLSALGGNNLFDLSGAKNLDVYLQDCKLGSGAVVVGAVPTGQGIANLTLVNCDSASTNYRSFRQTYQGTVSHETSVVRTSGATDGTTPISRKMVSNANSEFFAPLESDVLDPAVIYWNESLAAITINLPIVVEAGGNQALQNTGLTTKDFRMEVEYPGTSGNPQGVFANSGPANVLSVGTAYPLDVTSVWGNFLSAPVQQTVSLTFTPINKGLIRVRALLVRPNTTLYYDPQVI